jgi:hypothetical protein
MIILTNHAKERMKERGILKKDIEKVLLNSDRIYRENHRVIASKRINKEILEVVYVVENNKKIILTCYYL